MNAQLSTDQYLTHCWPISNRTMLDQIGTSDMCQGSLTSFIEDRFGNLNSALALNGGWTQVPSGIYFDTQEFTISVWVYPQQIGSGARVIDFGISPTSSNCNADDIFFRLGDTNSPVANEPLIGIYTSTGTASLIASSQTLIEKKWQFLTGTFNGSWLSIYIDGSLMGTTSLSYNNPIIIRNYNFIGKSCYSGHGYSTSHLDDLRFYNRSLNHGEILELMKQNLTGTNRRLA